MKITNPIQKHHGMALVYVLFIICAFTLFMINQAASSQAKSQSMALEYSLSQTHSILNMVFSYYQRHGSWPVSGKRCQMPEQFMDEIETESYNGWGYVIEGSDDCESDDDAFILVQLVPEEYVGIFESKFEDVSDSSAGAPKGARKLEISLTTNGGSDFMVDVGKLSDNSLDPLKLPVMNCKGLVRKTLSYQDAVCGSVNDPARVNFGFKFDADTTGLSNAVRKKKEAKITYEVLSGSVSSSGPITYNQFSEFPHIGSDGHQFANYRCPSSEKSINAVTLSWCEK